MDIVIREAKETNNLFQAEVYDPDFCETAIVEGVYFESEAFAEKYGRERWPDKEDNYGVTFRRAVMKNGKEAPTDGVVLYGDANYPGEIYICPVELENKLLEHMNENGCCPYKCKGHWFPKNYTFCAVSAHEDWIKFDEI